MSVLSRGVRTKEVKVAVVGLGYVGTPVAALFADVGFDVLGVDINEDKIRKISQGINPIEGKEPGLSDLLKRAVGRGRLRTTSDYRELSDRDIILISVETPVDDKTKMPRYVALRAAVGDIGEHMKRGSMIIIESTIAPQTMESVVLPLLEARSGFRVNEDFYLVHCPERVMPGKLLHNLRNCDRVVGVSCDQAGECAQEFYSHVVCGNLDVTDLLTAEVVKTAENAYRDVQIAFANELAMVCRELGADFWKVRELINKSPHRDVHQAGAGVGGHCIPKDSWLLISPLKKREDLKIIPHARHINDFMPFHVVALLEEGLSEAGKELTGAAVAVLGYSYLPNSDDTRNAPSIVLIEELKSLGVDVRVHDPYVEEYRSDLENVVRDADATVVMVAHDDYCTLDWREVTDLMAGRVFVDGRNVLGREKALELNLIYKAVGVGDN